MAEVQGGSFSEPAHDPALGVHSPLERTEHGLPARELPGARFEDM